MNFSDYRFRASSLGKLMSPTKGKTNLQIYTELVFKRDDFLKKYGALRDGLKSKENYRIKVEDLNKQIADLEPYKDDITLSDTALTYLNAVFIQEKYGRIKEISNKFTEKGNYAEEDSLSLLTEVEAKLYTKNKESLKNEWVQGTPDLILPDLVRDIKTKWDIWGFMNERGENPDYYWQLQAYMWLTGIKRAELVYTLVNTPEHLIYAEFSKQMYRDAIEDGSQEQTDMEAKVTKNMTYDDIGKAERVKIFAFEFNQADIELAKRYIKAGREYLATLTLNKV